MCSVTFIERSLVRFSIENYVVDNLPITHRNLFLSKLKHFSSGLLLDDSYKRIRKIL